jgi:hypothetical protein
MKLVLLLFALACAQYQVTFVNDVINDDKALAMTFVPEGCSPMGGFLDYEKSITYFCPYVPDDEDIFDFVSTIPEFPYWLDYACFPPDNGTITFISSCI